MADQNASISSGRTHILLIPGFGGFDALGTVEYYAGITPLFQHWNKTEKRPVVLRYFDNLPSAAVVTRAQRLRSYLAKRIARGEILPDDAVVLVGHSTGGLDIRQMMADLDNPDTDAVRVDGGFDVDVDTIRRAVRGIVFLSVPHWGTNIADWVHAHPFWRKTLITDMRVAAAGSEMFPFGQLQPRMAAGAARLTGADLFRAIEDTTAETNERFGKPGPMRTAEAHEAASEVALYLRHMDSDFHVINDLTSQPPSRGPRSPAHFSKGERMKELKRWTCPTLSYATVANSPFHFNSGSPAPVWDLTNPFSYPEIAKDDKLSAGTDIFYRICYRACAGGPFSVPVIKGEVTRTLDSSPTPPIEVWDNDGIVNTASMLWPKGENVLVEGDHMDIVGHYKLVEADSGSARKYRSYDALRSEPRFTDDAFQQIWREIFDFSVRVKKAEPPHREARAVASEQLSAATTGA